ncbi:MAG: class I SAM-dependent methyltransferase [Hydrogenophilales bacterium]|nr:class I SAM-dependent methyltransferase [Hydrogenophilales bacterium]
MATDDQEFSYISNDADYRHLEDPERYKLLYEEVGSVTANREIRWRSEWMYHFQPRAGATILELGAHNGPNLLHYGRLGHEVIGVELSTTLIATFETQKQLETEDVQARISMRQGWIEAFLPDKRYDYVLVTEVLEHVIDPVNILAKAAECVKPDGEVYISSPTQHWGNNTHVRGVPPKDLAQWLEQANLEPISLFTEPHGWTFCMARCKSLCA